MFIRSQRLNFNREKIMSAVVPSQYVFIEGTRAPTEVDFTKLTLQEIMQTSRYHELLKQIRKIEKVEIHQHFGGAVSLEFIQKYLPAEEYTEFLEFIEKLKGGVDYKEGFKAFSFIRKVLNSPERIKEAAFDFCRKQKADNVTFTELRTGLKNFGGGFQEYLDALVAGLEEGMAYYKIRVTLLLSLRRDTSIEDANETVDLVIKNLGEIVRGIDISGESTVGNGEGIFEPLKRAAANHIPITHHIAEDKREDEEQQWKELTVIKPNRVGHAVFLSQRARGLIEANKIVTEICIRSGLGVGMISLPGEHLGLEQYRKGHPVAFCTDDSTLFGDLSEELAIVACVLNLSIDQVVELQKKTLEYAF